MKNGQEQARTERTAARARATPAVAPLAEARTTQERSSAEARGVHPVDLGHALANTARHGASCPHCAQANAVTDDRDAQAGVRPGAHAARCRCGECEAGRAGTERDEGHCPSLDKDPMQDDPEVRRLIEAELEEPEEENEGENKGENEGGGGAEEEEPAAESVATEEALSELEAGVMSAMAGRKAEDFKAMSGFLSALSGGQPFAPAGTVVDGNPAGFPNILGLTTWSYGAWTYPDLQFDVTTKTPLFFGSPTSTAKIKPTTSADAVHGCIAAATGAQKYKSDTFTVGKKSETFDFFIDITAAYHNKIVQAEQEHLDDLLQAYTISIKKAADEVNALVGTPFTSDTEAKAKDAATDALAKRLPAKLSTNPANWKSVLRDLCRLTVSGRDALGTHTFQFPAGKPVVDAAAKKVTMTLGDGTTNIGTITSASLVKLESIP